MRRKAVNRSLQPWSYVQAAVPTTVKASLEVQAEREGKSVAEIAGRALMEYQRHCDGWNGSIPPAKEGEK